MPDTKTPEVPDWVNETPELSVHGYQLDMWDSGTTEQEIDLTREEYIALKQYLAHSRGLLHTDARLDPSTYLLLPNEWKLLEEAAEKLRIVLAAKAE